jgi:hypothetical protein
MQVEISQRVHRCVEVEQAMAELYRVFMERFPDETYLWKTLHEEELKHIAFLVNADIFDSLGEQAGQLQLPSEALVERALSMAMNSLEQLKKRAVTLEEALGMAVQLEDSVVEEFADTAVNNGGQQSAFIMLLNDTRSHADMLRDLMRRKGYIKVS